jgi:glycosyltransferase involved in cell wall biosynthesis
MRLVIQNTSKVWGGNEKWLGTLAEGLIARGHEVIVSCAQGAVSAELGARGIPVTPFRPRGAIDFVSGLTFAAWLRGQRPDVLLMTSWRPTAWTVAAAKAAGVPRIVMRLGIVRPFPRRTPKAVALRSVDELIVNSEEIRDVWTRSAPAPLKSHVNVVMNGVRSRRADREGLRAALRRELALEDSSILIGGAGHVAPRKGFDKLIRAFAEANVPDSTLAILGDGAHRADLERLARDIGVADRVAWLGHRDDGAGVIAAFDLFVLSSDNEGMANVMLEAMAAGVPAVAYDISGVRRAIGAVADRQQAGWVVSPADPGALAGAIGSACDSLRRNPEFFCALGEEAHWRAVNWFSPERMVEECEKILFRGSAPA